MFHNHYTHFTESSVSENNHQKTILLYKHLQKYFLTTKNTHPKSDLHTHGRDIISQFLIPHSIIEQFRSVFEFTAE